MRSGISCFTLVERGPTGQCVTFSSRRLRVYRAVTSETPHPALLTLQDRAPIIFRSYRLRIIKEGRWRCPVCRTVGGLFGNSHLASRLVRAGPRTTHPTKPVLFPTSPTPDPRRPRPERSPRSSAPCRADGAVGPAPIIVTAVLFPGRLPAVFPRARAHSRDTLPKMCCTFTRTGHLSQPGPERASLASP